MRLNKVIISLFLLLTYSIGFAHNLVPHCSGEIEHASLTENDSHHQHGHHEHLDEDVAAHDHIAHENHYDEDYLDLVICMLDDVEHGDEDCEQEHCFILGSNNLSLKNLSNVQLIYLVVGLVQNSFTIEQPEYVSSEYCYNYLSPPLEKSPHRGPPHTS